MNNNEFLNEDENSTLELLSKYSTEKQIEILTASYEIAEMENNEYEQKFFSALITKVAETQNRRSE